MKKIISLVIIFFCLFSLTGCPNTEEEPPKQKTSVVMTFDNGVVQRNSKQQNYLKYVIITEEFFNEFDVEITLYHDDSTTQTNNILQNLTLSKNQMSAFDINDLALTPFIQYGKYYYYYDFYFSEYPTLTRAKGTKFTVYFYQ